MIDPFYNVIRTAIIENLMNKKVCEVRVYSFDTFDVVFDNGLCLNVKLNNIVNLPTTEKEPTK